MNTRLLGILTVALGSIGSPVLMREAKAATCNSPFDNRTVLGTLDSYGLSFVPTANNPAVYEHPCSADRLKFDDPYYGHYHLGIKNTCVGANGCKLVPPSNRFEIDLTCASGHGGPAQCQAINPLDYPRYLSSHGPSPTLRMYMLPSPGQYCIVNPSGGMTCASQLGQFVAPYQVKMRFGSKTARLWGVRFDLIAVGTPAGPRYTFAKPRILIRDNMTAGSTHTWTTPPASKPWDQFQVTSVDPSTIGEVRIDGFGVQK